MPGERKACFAFLVVFSVAFMGSIQWNVYQQTEYDSRRHIFRNCRLQGTRGRHALVTLVTTPEYVDYATVLGKSVLIYSRLSCDVAKLCLLMRGVELGVQDLRKLESVGWEVREVERIAAPERINASNAKNARYVDLPTKLGIFNMTEYDGILYLDSDTLVLGDLNELFTGAVPEMRRNGKRVGWVRDQGGVKASNFFNAGVLLVRPERLLFDELIDFLHHGAYKPEFSEQGMLNKFFGGTQHVLSARFNMLTPIPMENTSLFESIRDDVRIFHSTWVKPKAAFYLVRCWQHGVYDFCREWMKLEALEISL